MLVSLIANLFFSSFVSLPEYLFPASYVCACANISVRALFTISWLSFVFRSFFLSKILFFLMVYSFSYLQSDVCTYRYLFKQGLGVLVDIYRSTVWRNEYRRKKWTQWARFKSWARPFAFPSPLTSFGKKENTSGVVVYVLDNDILVSEFELYSNYYVHFRINNFWKGINLLISQQWII